MPIQEVARLRLPDDRSTSVGVDKIRVRTGFIAVSGSTGTSSCGNESCGYCSV